MSYIFATAPIWAITAILYACAAVPKPTMQEAKIQQGALPPAFAAAGENERVALLLSASARAYEAGNIETLAAHVAGLDQSGAKPLADQADVTEAWRRALGEKGADKTIFRGRLLGPGYMASAASAGARITLNQIFAGGEKATVSLSAPQAEEQLSYSIRKPNGEVICKNTIAQQRTCSWMPIYSQRVTIELENNDTSKRAFFISVD